MAGPDTNTTPITTDESEGRGDYRTDKSFRDLLPISYKLIGWKTCKSLIL